MNAPLGQIGVDTGFGRCLKAVAERCDNIVEIGTYYGEGSTRCLVNGMKRTEQRLWTVEVNASLVEIARSKYRDPRVTFLHGSVTTAEEMNLDYAPSDPERQAIFLADQAALHDCPNILCCLPETIDLLVVDGGEYSSRFDFKKLKPRSRIIALDDIRGHRDIKNFAAHMALRCAKWIVIERNLHERYGYAVFERPTK